MRGIDARLTFNSPLHVRRIENLANMAKSGPVCLQGPRQRRRCHLRFWRMRHDDRFVRPHGNIKRNAKFAAGIGPLPYYPMPGAPQNTVIGGASLWSCLARKTPSTRGGQFFAHLSKPMKPPEPPAHRLPAAHQGLVRADREEQLLQSRTPAPIGRSRR